MPSLFKEEKFKVIVDPEIKIIPEFASLIKRDKTPDKKQSFCEMAYIYFMYDLKSPFAIYSETDRMDKVIKEVKLPADWKPDNAVNRAAAKYMELSDTPSSLSLRSTRETLLVSAKVLTKLREKIETKLDEFTEEDEVEGADEIVSSLVKSVTDLLKLSEQLPKVISTIEDLEEKVRKELSIERKIKGGGGTNAFED